MSYKNDLIGLKFGLLIVLSMAGKTKQNKLRWLCKCTCGKEKVIVGASLTMGMTKSCGCLRATIVLPKENKDLIGKRFGKILIIGLAQTELASKSTGKRSRIKYKCECDCGNIKDISIYSLTSGATNSCGCIQREYAQKSRRKYPKAESTVRRIFSGYKSNASSRGLSFEITFKEFQDIGTQYCVYCGQPPTERNTKHIKSASAILFNGIDRVDNNIGYTVDNCRPCCSLCNRMKSDMSRQDFLKHISKINDYKPI